MSEEKQKRQEREQKQKDKKRRDQQEISLFFTLDNIFYNNNLKNKSIIYRKMHEPKEREKLIDLIVENGNIQDVYILTKKYNAILSNVYNGYKLNDKEITKAEAETIKKSELKLFRILKNTLDFKEYHSKHENHYFKNMQEAYNFLIVPKNKDYIIGTITNDTEKIYILNKKYLTILNSLYRPYKQTEKQAETKTHQKTVKQTQKTKQKNSFILFLSILIGIIISIIKIIGYCVILPLILIFRRH